MGPFGPDAWNGEETMTTFLSSLKTTVVAGAACLAFTAGAFSPSALADGHVAKIISGLDRPDAEVARDAGRKPAEVIEFIGIKPGMTVWDHASGGGYYTAMFSAVVGPEGKVYAQNSENFWPRLQETTEPRHKALGNVETYVGRITDFDGPDASIDVVFVGLIYHHLHYSEASGEGLPANSKAYYAQVMKMLKPGGIIAFTEHQAPDGTPRAQSAAWHRAALKNAIDDLTAAGFEFAGSSDVLANPDDPQNIHFRDLSSGRDTSQRFLVKFRKPA